MSWLPAGPAGAQWVQETVSLHGGWSSVWLSSDCTHEPIGTLLAAHPEILEVWQWNPLGSTTQFTEAPGLPVQPDAAWKVWRRDQPESSTLARLSGNAAYLFRTEAGTNAFTLGLTGRPLLPKYQFGTAGANFVGFPVPDPPDAAIRSLDHFFSWSAVLKSNPPVFEYNNGPDAPQMPTLAVPRTTAVERGRAYWIMNSVYADYYGPLRVTMLGDGLHYGDTRNTLTVRIRNVTDPAKQQNVTASLTPAASASPPEGQPPVAGPVPLIVRGLRDPETLEFTYEPVSAEGISRTLAPGEETEVVLSVDRPAMAGAPGDVFQSLLQVSDSLNQTRIDLPVSAVTTSYAGLWAGAAVITTVDQVIGSEKVESANTSSPFTVRLLLHRAPDGQTTLLQRVYLGIRDGQPVAGVTESGVRETGAGGLSRLSSAGFPDALRLPGTGRLDLSGPVSFAVELGYNDPSNPFVHAYHPDHDNLDARFETVLPEGVESFTIRRAITLEFLDALPGLNEPGWGSTTLGGQYTETISGLRTVPLTITGTFLLNRVSPVPALLP